MWVDAFREADAEGTELERRDGMGPKDRNKMRTSNEIKPQEATGYLFFLASLESGVSRTSFSRVLRLHPTCKNQEQKETWNSGRWGDVCNDFWSGSVGPGRELRVSTAHSST